MENTQEHNKAGRQSFVEQLAQRLGIAANATTVYGEPVERGEITVIPVAKVRYGFGGGSGINKTGEEGVGGGGGVSVTPTGYIEIKGGNTRFRKIRDPQTLITTLAVSGVFALLLVRSIGRLVQRKTAKKTDLT